MSSGEMSPNDILHPAIAWSQEVNEMMPISFLDWFFAGRYPGTAYVTLFGLNSVINSYRKIRVATARKSARLFQLRSDCQAQREISDIGCEGLVQRWADQVPEEQKKSHRKFSLILPTSPLPNWG